MKWNGEGRKLNKKTQNLKLYSSAPKKDHLVLLGCKTRHVA